MTKHITRVALKDIAIAMGVAFIVMSVVNILGANEDVILVGIGVSIGVATGIEIGVASRASIKHGVYK